ncbi:MAG TPA: nuclear transport factor 2 family protein [Rhizomicrobium sp.]|jgi:hypothetical protein
MTKTTTSRRTLVAAGGSVLAAAALAPKAAGAQPDKSLSPQNEAIIRRHYQTWNDKDWHAEDMLLADDFTFSSAAGDDHISKAAFKKQCWDTQIGHIKKFDLVRIFGSGDEAFVMYDCLTTNDKTFRNVEYLELGNGKVRSIWCFFGAPSNFPSAVSARPT